MKERGRDRRVIAAGRASFALSLAVLMLVVYFQIAYRSAVPLYPVAMIIPLVMLLAFFLRPSRLPGEWPRGLREQDLVGIIRQAGRTAKKGERGVTARLGKMAAVTFPLDKEGKMKGTYLVDATASGYGLMMASILLWPLSAFSIPLMVRNVLRAREFVFAGPTSAGDGGGLGPCGDIKPLIVDSLFELHRISSEAHESARSDYQDRIVVAALMALAAWPVILVTTGPLGWWTLSPPHLLLASLVPPLIMFAAYYVHVRRRLLPTVQGTGLWADKLGRALRAEADNAVAPEGSSLQTVLEALPHLPEWLELRRRSLAFRHPGTGFVVAALLTLGIILSALAYSTAASGDAARALLLAAGAGAGLAGGSGLYLWQVRKDRREAQGSLREFEERMGRLNELLGPDLRER